MQLVKKEAKSILKMLNSNRMRSLIPYLIWTGVSLSIYTGLIVKIIGSTIPNDTAD